MDTIFMNSENSKTSDLHRVLFSFTDKINLKRSDKCVALSNLSIYYTWKNIKKLYKINKFKISALTWNEGFELPDGPYSVSDIQDYPYPLSPTGRICHERLSSVPLWRIYTSWIPFWVSARKIFFSTAAPMRILVKKLKSTIYNIIIFINLFWWNLYKQVWKTLFARKYIIYNLGVT